MQEIIPEYWKDLSLDNIFYMNPEGVEFKEEWRDIIGYEGLYKVSDLGTGKTHEKRKTIGKDAAIEIFKSNEYVPYLAYKYNISTTTVRDIKTGRTWRNVTKLIADG